MFKQVYKSTVKNLFRSGLFWLVMLVVISIHFYNGTGNSFGRSIIDPNDGSYIRITDTDPRFTMNYETYLKKTSNSVSATMRYTLPIVAILSVVLILNRDYGDNFYEIEKASNVKPSVYVLGRLSAVLTVNFATAIILTFIEFYFFFAIRSPLKMMGTMCFITDSLIRLLRCAVFMLFPPVVLYVGLTFVFGYISRSGIIASLGSIGYMMICRLLDTTLKWSSPKIYHDYFSPLPDKLWNYLYYYDSFSFESMIRTSSTSLGKAAFCVIFFVAVGSLFMFITYLITRKRDK